VTLVDHAVHRHAAHYLYDHQARGHNLEQWVIASPAQPTREQLTALGLPADAEWHIGLLDLEVQHWVYVARRPMSPGVCALCRPAGTAVEL
jgi:hypothetical protein